ncbi:MAG: hypothetical protein M3525_08390 [Acidobacteriota bacterium]|nr:hypothetical protein [Acidobacteriota bacterium]
MLDRSVAAAQTGTPYEQAFVRAVGALINLALAANNAPVIEKDARGRSDIETLWKQMILVRTALYQDNFAFTDDVDTSEKPISDLARKAIAESGDWDDEDEQ